MSMNGIKCGVPIVNFPVPDKNKSKKQTFLMKPEKVVVHNTYNHAKAKAEASYMVGNNNWTSFHSVVDETKIVECIPFNRNAWHCGNYYGNRHYIGVEIAKSTGDIKEFLQAELNAAKYIAAILIKYNWGIDRVVTHQYCSKKYCPHKTLDLGWNRFIRLVKNELENLRGIKMPKSPKVKIEGGYSVRVNTPNDVLNVREMPSASSKKVSSYRDKSVIYNHQVIKNSEGTWYKIEYASGRFGFVSAKYCVGIVSKQNAS